MKVVFNRQSLLNAASLAQNSVSASGALPILSNVLIDAAEDGVTMMGTDLETFLRIDLEGARVEEVGRVTVPARKLGDIVRLLPDQEVGLVVAGTRATLTCGRNVYQLATMDPDDYPEWPQTEYISRITLKQADLRKILENTTFAIPKRDPRKVLMGALFTLTPDGLVCVATDGRKLGKVVVHPVEVVGKEEASAIVPGKALDDVHRALSGEGEIEFSISRRQAIFKLPNMTHLTSVIEGSYPNYNAVIPDGFKRTIDLPKTAFHDAVVRAGILAERKFNSIVLNFERNKIEIQAQSFEAGSFRGEVEIAYEGDPFRIAFNYTYLHEVFKILPDEIARMKIKEVTAPVVFECESDPDSMFLVMPVRMSDIETREPEDYDDEDEDEDFEDDDDEGEDEE